MKLGDWWRDRSGRAKAVTVLAVLELLQIGLCFGTPTVVSWHDALLHVHSSDPFRALGAMIWEAILCGLTLLLMILAAVAFPGVSPDREDRVKLND